MRNLPLKIVLALAALVLAYALLGTDRYWFLQNRLVVTQVGDVKLPPGSRYGREEVSWYGVHLPRETSKAEQIWTAYKNLRGIKPPPPERSYQTMSEPKLGYSSYEVGILGMPFFFYNAYGHALMTESEWGKSFLPLDDKTIAELSKASGRDVTANGLYPYWKHLWGWGFVLLLALAGWIWHRGVVRRREELGLID